MEKQIKDVFISHASEDVQGVVHPLEKALKKVGISCWVSENEIGIADGIAEKINEGFKLSRYFISVLSKHSFRKPWVIAELWAAKNKEESSKSKEKLLCIIMVGSENEIEEIRGEYPFIGDKLYLTWNGDADDIANKLIKEIQSPSKNEEADGNDLHSNKTTIANGNENNKIIVNGVELVWQCKENDSKYKCEEWICTSDDSVMIKIPADKFWRGSELGDGSGNEMPITQVYLDEYFIDKYPVTNKQFEKFVEEYEKIHECHFVTTAEKNGGVWECVGNEWIRLPKKWRDYYSHSTKNHPVVAVSVEDAEAYCEWTSKRLPYEAEWERAARGDDASIYP